MAAPVQQSDAETTLVARRSGARLLPPGTKLIAVHRGSLQQGVVGLYDMRYSLGTFPVRFGVQYRNLLYLDVERVVEVPEEYATVIRLDRVQKKGA